MKKIISLFIVFALTVGMLPPLQVHALEDVTPNSGTDELLLYPTPRKMVTDSGEFELKDGNIKTDDPSLKAVEKVLTDAKELANVELSVGNDGMIQFEKDTSLHEQGYSLTINQEGVSISYKDKEGAYYAAVTFYQILYQQGAKLPYLTIEDDYPDFKYRGFDMDISRNRIPNVDTLKRVIDFMANLKFNQMFLYLEGFSYAYAHYGQVWSGGDPITPEQVKEISDYANNLGIDVIPMQNSFGHSYQWIAHQDFKHLGDLDNSTTFNVLNPDTQEFLSNIYDDLALGFTSEFLHVGGDETALDLNNGRAAAAYREKYSKEPTQGDLYIESMKKIYEIATGKGKKVFYWADMIINHDTYKEAKEAMPEGIAMDWGYLYDYDFDKNAKKLNEAQIPFYVCPGDSSWSTITGNTFVMKKNAETAAKAGRDNKAIGYLMTNWGDAGHYQNIITTYPAIAYAGGLSWCYDTNVETGEGYNTKYDVFLNKFLYQDTTNTLSQAYSELADFSHNFLPYGWNGNWIANCLVEPWTENARLMEYMDFQKDGKDNQITPEVRDLALEQCKQVSEAALAFLDKLEKTNITADDAQILRKEFENTAELTKIAADYVAMRLRLFVGEKITEPVTTREEEIETAISNSKEFQDMIKDFKFIWNSRDNYGELPSTLGWISKPSMMYRDIAGVSKIYEPQEDGNLFLKTPETIGTHLQVDDFVVNGWTWTNYGTGMPAISNTYMGTETVGQLKNALNAGVFSIKEPMQGVTGKVFAYDSAAAIKGGFYNDNPQWGALLPRCGWPGLLPSDGDYVFTVKMKYESGLAVNWGNLQFSGTANKLSDGSLTDIPQQTIAAPITGPDENGWYNVEVKFKASDVAGISFGIIPANNIQDTLYMTDLDLRAVKPDVIISSEVPQYNEIKLNEVIHVPTAVSNGTEEIKVVLTKPDGTEDEVKMNDKIIADTEGFYRLTYSAADAVNTLQIVFEVKVQSDNLFLIHDENATGFIPALQFFSLSNPYYDRNYGFNDDKMLVSYGNDTNTVSQYATLSSNIEGGNGQVVVLDTSNLIGNNRIIAINFCSEVEVGKTYYVTARMKFERGEMSNGLDLAPYKFVLNYFNETITDQADDTKYIDIEKLLSSEEAAKAKNGEWFTFTQKITVPESVQIQGKQMAPTAMNVMFMTSSREEAEDQHKMMLDDVVLVEVNEIQSVEAFDDLHVQFATKLEDIDLPETVTVTLENGTTKELKVDWKCDTFDGNQIGSYEFIGTIKTDSNTFNSQNLKASIRVVVDKEVHQLTKVEVKQPSCTTEGHIEYWVCEDCGKLFKDENCTIEISLNDTVLKAKGHQVMVVNEKEATCTEEGYTGDHICKECHEVFEKGKILPKLEHHYENGKCSECGEDQPTTPMDPITPETPNDHVDEKEEGSVDTSDASQMIIWLTCLMLTGFGWFFYLSRKRSRE